MFAELIVNAYNKVTPYTAPQMARQVDEDNFVSCYTSCMNTAWTIVSIFGVGASSEPGAIKMCERKSGFINQILANNVVMVLRYPFADHYSCVIIHENMCYLCESLQGEHGLKVCIMSKHQLVVIVSQYKYGGGFGHCVFDCWPLNEHVYLTVRKFKCHPFTRKEQKIIKNAKKEREKYKPEILDLAKVKF